MAKDHQLLRNQFVAILGSQNVYFQPPASIKLSYPCIIYKLDDMTGVHADNKRYLGTNKYLVTVIDRNPDSLIPGKIFNMPYCAFEDYLVVDNLNHYIYTLHW
jgi:hypothetical protein